MLYRCLVVVAIAAIVYGILALAGRFRPAPVPRWAPLALSACFPVGAWPMLQTTASGQAAVPYALAGFVLDLFSFTAWHINRRA